MRVELKNIGNQGPEHFQQSGTADHLWQSRAYKEGFAPMRKKRHQSKSTLGTSAYWGTVS